MTYRLRTGMVAALVTALSTTAFAIGPDGPHLAHAERNAEAWAAEDAEIDAKLAELEARFGKKPNIVYILTDDICWGELGWQGGGKHRRTPSEALDAMAFEGMRFWSSYAEPSCTPKCAPAASFDDCWQSAA